MEDRDRWIPGKSGRRCKNASAGNRHARFIAFCPAGHPAARGLMAPPHIRTPYERGGSAWESLRSCRCQERAARENVTGLYRARRPPAASETTRPSWNRGRISRAIILTRHMTYLLGSAIGSGRKAFSHACEGTALQSPGRKPELP